MSCGRRYAIIISPKRGGPTAQVRGCMTSERSGSDGKAARFDLPLVFGLCLLMALVMSVTRRYQREDYRYKLFRFL